ASSLPSLPTASQLQPLPNWPRAFSLIFALSWSKPPKVELIADPRSPDGAPPPVGPIISQHIHWFAWPPPLLRTAVRTDSGTPLRFRIRSSIDLDCRSP